MKPNISKIEVPSISKISDQLSSVYFFDSYKTPITNSERSALEIYLGLVSQTPTWVNCLMTIRNKLVTTIDLKNLGHLDDTDPVKTGNDYRVGDRVGIFSILSLSDREVILEDNDKHLNAKVSVCKLGEDVKIAVAISTVVDIKNTFGRIYMLFVTPIHKLISPAMLRLADMRNNKA